MKYTVLFLIFIFFSGKAQNEESQSILNSRPNLVFFLSDDQDVLDYGCYGNPTAYTPTVDALAKEGVKFTQAYTGQAICAPSRSQLFTGMYPVKNGVYANHIGAKPDIKSITYYLKKAGYDVILAGKSHVKPDSVFDWTYYWEDEQISKDWPHEGVPITKIKEYFKTTKKPFCMFITSHFPHGPFASNKAYNKKNIIDHPYLKRDKTSIRKLEGYYANIEIEDHQIKSVVEALDNSSHKANTLFMYASDHGSSGKYSLYNSGLHVPLIARWENVIKPNTTSNALVHFTDILPTFLELAGVEIPKEVDGNSIVPILRGKLKEVNDYVYGVETHQNLLNPSIYPSRMVMNKDYKYIRNFNAYSIYKENLGSDEALNIFIKRGAEKYKERAYEEFYDLKKDPFELKNLADDGMYKSLLNQFSSQLDKWMEEQNDFLLINKTPLLKAPNNPLDKNSANNPIPKEIQGILDYKKAI